MRSISVMLFNHIILYVMSIALHCQLIIYVCFIYLFYC